MKVLEISARKGGVGTTTVACALALALSKQNTDKVLLIDTSHNTEAFSVLGLPNPIGRSSATVGEHGLTVMNIPVSEVNDRLPIGQYEFVVIDAGKTYGVDNSYFGQTPFRVAVVRNSYLSLRSETFSKANNDAVVCVHEIGHVLTEGDVRQVVGKTIPETPVTTFLVDNAVARSVDAGLFSSRTQLWDEWTTEFLGQHGLTTATV
jgi:hypothetical protein